MQKIIDEIVERAKANRQRIVLPEGTEERTLKAANQILTDGVADLIILGNPAEIDACAKEWGLGNISKATIIDPMNHPKKEEYAQLLCELRKKKGMTIEEAASVIAAPFWSTIEKLPAEEQKRLAYLRTVFPSLLITGPFSIVFGFEGGLMALNDRLKLRSMVVGEKDDKVMIASEEAAIRVMEPDAENIWAPAGGEPVIIRVKEGAF